MKKEGLLHKELLELLCQAGHGDCIMITDRGFPLPCTPHTRVIDLGLIPGYPDFNTVMRAVLAELAIDWLYFARQTLEYNPTMIDLAKTLIPQGTGITFMDHGDLKDAVLNPELYRQKTQTLSPNQIQDRSTLPPNNRIIGFIRTGEFTKYTNLLIECGVAF